MPDGHAQPGRRRTGLVVAAVVAALLPAAGVLPVASRSLGAAPASASASSATKVGAWSRDWRWFDQAVGPVDVYRGYDAGFHFPTWQQTAAYLAHPAAAQNDYSFQLPPAAVAAGTQDGTLRTFLASTPKNIVLTNHHEPEQEIEAGLFTFTEFRRANVRLNALVDAQNALDGGTRRVSVILMISTFTGFKGRNAENYWPTAAKGDGGTVDLVSVDVYNAPHATGTAGIPLGYTDGVNWKTTARLMSPALTFARAHSTPWAVSELGFLEDVNNPGRKAQALRDAVAYAKANGALWISVWDSRGGRADWELRFNNPPVPSTSSTSTAVQAWKALVNAP
ncbi:MAG: hypothetical protein ACJ73E_03535 [Mycobacteriales bacterium]